MTPEEVENWSNRFCKPVAKSMAKHLNDFEKLIRIDMIHALEDQGDGTYKLVTLTPNGNISK